MITPIENLISEFETIRKKIPEIRDFYWLKIDRYNEVDIQRGVAFDERFEQHRSKLFHIIDVFSAFIEKSFAPTSEEVAKEIALQKICVEFPGFNEWNEEAKKAILDREIIIILEQKNKKNTDFKVGFGKKQIIEKLQNLTISNNKIFTTEFINYYNSLDPNPSSHNSQKFFVRNYLLNLGYNKDLVSSLKFSQRAKRTKLIVNFPDGTIIHEKTATKTLSETLIKIGVENIIPLNIIVNNFPFISMNKQSMRMATYLEKGYYINTHSSTIIKKTQLEEISKRLNLNLNIEITED